MRKSTASLVVVSLLSWAAATVAGTSSSEVTQAAVVDLQWRDFREFSQRQREQGAAVDDARRAVPVDRVFATLLKVALDQFPATRSMRWEVLLTDDDGVEARAYPSGQVILSTPFLARYVRSNDELAFLLAHEMAHVLLEHGRASYEAAVPLTRLAGKVDARLIHENLQSSLALQLKLYPLMRAQEREADRLAVELAAAAGFRQSAGAALLARMAGEGDESSMTHDSLRSRSAALQLSLP